MPVILLALSALAAGCATVPTSDVTVVNSRENPALVRPLAAPGWEPFQHTASITNTIDVTIFTVPPDKRLVIEFVSGFCNTSQNVPVQTVRLSGSVDHFLTPTIFAANPGTGTSFAVVTQQTRIYANPTAAVKLAVFPTSNSSTTTCSISLSGHLTGL